MTIYSNMTNIASLIGDATRTTILVALLEGKALPAGELARLANVSPLNRQRPPYEIGGWGSFDRRSVEPSSLLPTC